MQFQKNCKKGCIMSINAVVHQNSKTVTLYSPTGETITINYDEYRRACSDGSIGSIFNSKQSTSGASGWGDTFEHKAAEESFESTVEPLPDEETTEIAQEEVVNAEQGAEESAKAPEGKSTEPAAPTFKEGEDGAVRVTSSTVSKGNCTLEPDEDGYVKLPEEYQEKYTAAGEDEDAQRKVILAFFNDEKYFPKQTVTETSNVYGNKNYKDGTGIGFNAEFTKIKLVDGNGKPIKENQKARFEELNKIYDEEFNTKLNSNEELEKAYAAIDKDQYMTPAEKEAAKELKKVQIQDRLIAQEGVNTYFGDEIDSLSKTITGTTADKNTYYQLVMSQEDKDEVAKEYASISSEIDELLNKTPITDEDEEKFANLVTEYNKRFGDEKISDGYKLSEHHEADETRKNEVIRKMAALAQTEAIESVMGSNTFTDKQKTELASARMVESLTHQDEIARLALQMKNSTNEAEKAEIKKKIDKLNDDKDLNIGKIKDTLVVDSAYNHLCFEAAKQNFDNTVVHWDKAGAKADEAENPEKNNTYLNKAARNLIKTNAEFRKSTCDEVAEGKGDFEVDGQWYKFNSAKYKDTMLRASNLSRTGQVDTTRNADYYASVDEFGGGNNGYGLAFADNYLAHKKAKREDAPATLKEREYSREMFEIAGIETGIDPTRKTRNKEYLKAFADGAVIGGLTGLLGETVKAAQGIKYAGTVLTTLSGVATGMVSYTGTETGQVEVTGQNTTITERQEYSPATGQWVTTSHQETVVTNSSMQDVVVSYSGEVQAELPYDTEKLVDYSGKKHNNFNPANILMDALFGGISAVGLKGLQNWLGRKHEKNYNNKPTKHDYARGNEGFQQKTTTVVEPENIPVKAETTRTVEETVEVPIAKHPYTMRARRVGKQNEGDTLAEVIRAKYNLTSSADIKKVLDYVIKENGLGNVSRNSIKKFDLPDVIPDSVLGTEIHYVDNDPKMSRFDLAKGKGSSNNGSINGTTSYTSTTTVNGMDYWDTNVNKK